MADSRLVRARLVIVGDGPQEQRLKHEAAALALSGRVLFAGRQDDVVPWLQALDAFALPSTANEGVPQALMQAMAAGIPVVSTRVGAIPELVEDEATGLLIAPGQPHELAGALARLLEDRVFATRMAKAARASIVENFSSAKMLDRMAAVLLEATGGR
jgi:glycosyltransferase involved in cell wall biosynthesis